MIIIISPYDYIKDFLDRAARFFFVPDVPRLCYNIPMKKCEKRDILYRQWGCSSPRAAALLVHGLGGHSNNWEHVAKFLMERDIICYGIELKGFGQTEGLKGHISSLSV